jgi:hypothetical protein
MGCKFGLDLLEAGGFVFFGVDGGGARGRIVRL